MRRTGLCVYIYIGVDAEKGGRFPPSASPSLVLRCRRLRRYTCAGIRFLRSRVFRRTERSEMGQQSLIYSFVARGTVILAEYTEFQGNFRSIAVQFLQKLPASNNRVTYICDGHTCNYLVEDGYTYCVLAIEAIGRQVPIAFLDRIKEDFNKRYGGGKAATALANSLNREFGSKLKEHMQYCADHPEEISKLAEVKAQVSEVKGVMMENIVKVIGRGEIIDVLVDKTENLRSQVPKIHLLMSLCACTRFQADRNIDEVEDVVSEYED
ncbi:hypothetical protein ZIOFF_015717 [Zingiber officinale]|uniref:Uncharacterized protein n=1 Tax=Zingiber officinale TaxID=94328 RepID=A0A8J5LQG7_ZINOF|nr:hypothetical protein ZIOFF_015717 [Zingiber officinale]